jgi:hypothetical protein
LIPIVYSAYILFGGIAEQVLPEQLRDLLFFQWASFYRVSLKMPFGTSRKSDFLKKIKKTPGRLKNRGDGGRGHFL